MAFLQYGDDTFELPAGDTIVGSGTQAGLRLSNVDLSARHFTIQRGGDGQVIVRPASAQQIVVVNGRQVAQQGVALSHGDVVEAGAAEFVYLSDVAAPRPERTRASGAAYLVNQSERVAYPLSKKSVSIGRDVASHIVLRDPSVSRFHADVRAEAGQYVLYAQGSTGTRVNGQAVNGPRLLEEGDEIGIGGQTFRFTRQPLGPGLTPVSLGAGEEDDSLSRRDTELSMGAVTGSAYAAGASRRPIVPIILAVLVVISVAAYFVMR
jgi:pSer/pThr/pTyr-binding forkhead associated (FHA) protein